jgi:hypothetical protein
MAWVFLELIVKSMALEQARTYSGSLPMGEWQVLVQVQSFNSSHHLLFV